jgi:repressor LexA
MELSATTRAFVANVDAALRQRGLSRAELSRATGIAESNLSRLMKGAAAPALATVAQVAAALGLRPDDLTGDLPVRVFGTVPCGPPAPVPASDLAPVGLLRVHDLFGPPADLFAVVAHGRSMVGVGIHDGDYLVFRSQAEADNRQIVLASIDGESTTKRWVVTGARRFLEACDGPKPTRVAADAATLHGVLVGVVRKVK